MARILITNARLSKYSGSEVSALELAQSFSALGHESDFYTAAADGPLGADITRENYRIYLPAEGEDLSAIKYDLIWVRHQFIPPGLLRLGTQISMPNLVFEHLSPTTPLEAPAIDAVTPEAAALIVANSPETADALEAKGIPGDRIEVLNNAAPAGFLGSSPTSRTLRRVLVVTNHCPTELYRAIEILMQRGVMVTTVGESFRDGRQVSPSLVREHDVVISIGKTVQYAILGNRPPYVYDHFGGPGYLMTLDDYCFAEYYNYSGRSNPQYRNPVLIADELQREFADAADTLSAYRADNIDRYVLERRLHSLEGRLLGSGGGERYVSHGDVVYTEHLHDVIAEFERRIGRLERREENLFRVIRSKLSMVVPKRWLIWMGCRVPKRTKDLQLEQLAEGQQGSKFCIIWRRSRLYRTLSK